MSDATYVAASESSGACKPSADKPTSHIETVLAQRALSRLNADIVDFLVGENINSFRIAGGAMLHGIPKDVDLWASDNPSYKKFLVSRQDNADLLMPVDVCYGGVDYQFCTAFADTLEGLIAKFDFAHCQVGAEIALVQRPGNPAWVPAVTKVAFSTAWATAMAVQGTWYCGGESDVNSLARIPEVARKLNLDRGETRALTLQVIEKIVANPAGNIEKFKQFKR
jgi:hypothetical protein